MIPMSYNATLIRTRTVSPETCPQANRTCKDDYYSPNARLDYLLRSIFVVVLGLMHDR